MKKSMIQYLSRQGTERFYVVLQVEKHELHSEYAGPDKG